jgi:hypothetical protein
MKHKIGKDKAREIANKYFSTVEVEYWEIDCSEYTGRDEVWWSLIFEYENDYQELNHFAIKIHTMTGEVEVPHL